MQFSFLKKFSTKTKKEAKITDISSKIPYACFYNDKTVLTKNGELIQVIKITGYLTDNNLLNNSDVRLKIRESIQKHITSKDVAFWIHTIRHKSKIELSDISNKNSFEYRVHSKWRSENELNKLFKNEIYITLISKGKDYSLKSPLEIFSFFNTQLLKRDFFNHLNQSVEMLTGISEKITKDLEEFGSKTLSIHKHDDLYYPEHLTFFDKLLNGLSLKCELPISDISEFLSISNVNFTFNRIKVQNSVRKKEIAVFSLKEYQEVSMSLVDKMLNLPIELIIFQSFESTNAEDVTDWYKFQHKILKASEDFDFLKHSGIVDITEPDNPSDTFYGEHQLNIMITGDNEIDLAKKLEIFFNYAKEVGFVLVREDLFIEDCFYSALPANFSFLQRRSPITIQRVGGFAFINNYPSGNAKGSVWGEPVTIFKTIKKNPYFFNYHTPNSDNAHIVITGPSKSGKTTLSNFLLLESLKFKPRIFSISLDNSSDSFFRAVGYKTKIASLDSLYSGIVRFNPFSLLHSKKREVFKRQTESLNFIKHFILTLIEIGGGQDVKKDEKEDVEAAILNLSKNYSSVFTLEDFAKNMLKLNSSKQKLSTWISGEYKAIFGNQSDDFETIDDIISFNLSEIVHNSDLLSVIMQYIMYRVELELDGHKTIFRIEDVNEVLKTDFLQDEQLILWLKKIKKYNCICMLTLNTENKKECKRIIPDSLAATVQTKIYLSENISETSEKSLKDLYMEKFLLNNEQFTQFASLNRLEKEIMIEHNMVSVSCIFDFSRHIVESLLLSSTTEVNLLVKECIHRLDSESFEKWIKEIDSMAGINNT